jgi:hypothetical protein
LYRCCWNGQSRQVLASFFLKKREDFQMLSIFPPQ